MAALVADRQLDGHGRVRLDTVGAELARDLQLRHVGRVDQRRAEIYDDRQRKREHPAVQRRQTDQQQPVDQARQEQEPAHAYAPATTGTATDRVTSVITSSAAWRVIHRSGSRMSRWMRAGRTNSFTSSGST